MRAMPFVAALLFVVQPAVATAQSFLLQGSAGPTALDSSQNLSDGLDPGRSLAAGLGFSPTPRVTLLVEVDRSERASHQRRDARGSLSGYRGGTATLAEAQLRLSLFPADRVGPYALVGFAAGLSRPNVNEMFPDPVTNSVLSVECHRPLTIR